MEKIYLAARYSRHEEMRDYRSQLERWGYKVTSRWIDGGHQLSKEELGDEAEKKRSQFALEDFADLEDADTVINFTEEPRATNSRGGRHVEFGYALGLGYRVIVIGPRENVFHCLPCVGWYPTWDAFVHSGVLD